MPGGNLVTINNLRIQGARPDGTAAPGASMVVIVDFDPGQSGCDLSNDSESGFCSPGAEIQFYVDGNLLNDETATGYDGSLGGYSVASSNFMAPDSGSVQVTVISSNSLQESIPVVAVGSESSDGMVTVNYLSCGNSPYFTCSCESDGELILYYTRTVTDEGNGTAYVNVFVDGVQVVANEPTSTGGGGTAVDSVAINCPNLSTGHTILVQGQNGDPGASVVLAANTPLGGNYSPTGSTSVVTGQNNVGGLLMGSTSVAVSTAISASPVKTVAVTPAATAGVCQGMVRNGNFDLSCVLTPGNEILIAGGILAVGALAMVFLILPKEGEL